MNQEESLRHEIREALELYVRPAPGLVVKAMERVHAESNRAGVGGLLQGPVWAAGVLAAAAAIAVLAMAIHQATHRRQVEPSGDRPAAFVCANVPQLLVEPLPQGARPVHSAANALIAAESVGPRDHLHIYAAWVTDPFWGKMGWSSPPAPRVTWIVEGTQTVESEPPLDGKAGTPAYTRGTLLRVVTLIDDASLAVAGHFGCGPAS